MFFERTSLMKWMEGDGKGGRAGERRAAKGRKRGREGKVSVTVGTNLFSTLTRLCPVTGNLVKSISIGV